ncbi:MAG TPA: DUF2231 domain-containing protein [Candidatus Thermoplasmatota archaeon]|nr:DUF2231 domain-containing protein [Candidatus Thermoplasmatota archaeon]
MAPLHPLFVHAPLALLPTAALLATLAATQRYPWAAPATVLVLALGAAGAAAAVVTGLIDHEPLEDELEGTEAWEVVERHEYLGIATAVAAGAVALLLLWKRGTWAAASWRWGAVAALWGVVVLVLFTGWQGGRLPYEFGVNTPP